MSGHGDPNHLKAMKMWTYITFGGSTSSPVFGAYTLANERARAPRRTFLPEEAGQEAPLADCNPFDFICTAE
jgi:hypothetical protein